VIRLAVRVKREQAEIVLAELLELAPAGVEEVAVGAEEVEYAVYGAPGELPALPALDAIVGEALVEISTSEVADDWRERWKEFHRPVLIEAPSGAGEAQRRVPSLHVRPPWEAPSHLAPARVCEIVIDPGQAFGTGAHASTRLCLELLLALCAEQQPEGGLLDVGTGSGVLAIAAAMLGFRPILGLDNESESVQAARQNAEVNGVGIDVRRFDLRNEALPWIDSGSGPDASARPPIVMTANLLRPLLIDLARMIPRAPAHLIAGGLLVHEADEIADVFATALGMRERERRERGEWSALWLTAADQAASGISVAARTIAR
jgi:ribosomal protein L11 methyltransferase